MFTCLQFKKKLLIIIPIFLISNFATIYACGKNGFAALMLKNAIFTRRASSGGKAGGLPCPFSKIQTFCSDFAKTLPLYRKKVPCLCASVGYIFI